MHAAGGGRGDMRLTLIWCLCDGVEGETLACQGSPQGEVARSACMWIWLDVVCVDVYIDMVSVTGTMCFGLPEMAWTDSGRADARCEGISLTVFTRPRHVSRCCHASLDKCTSTVMHVEHVCSLVLSA